MYTQEIKNEFVELRASGLSFDAIAEKLNISKSTLLRWHRDHDAEIRALRAIELDAIYDEIFLPRQAQADCLAALQARLEHELADRDIRCLPTPQLMKAAAIVRKEIRDLRKHTVHAFLPPAVAPIAAPELHPQIPDTNSPSNEGKMTPL